MKHLYVLDKDDIAQVLANHFNCDVKDVSLTIEPVLKGYGLDERAEYQPVATVKAKDEKR